MHIYQIIDEALNRYTSSCTYWQSPCLFLFKLYLQWASEKNPYIFFDLLQTITVSSLMICNGFLQISLKLLNPLLYNFTGAIAMGILRFGQNLFFLFSSGLYSSGTCPWYSMQNIQASNLMRMVYFVMIVVNMNAKWFGKAQIFSRSAESQVKVTGKVIRCKKIKRHNFDSMIDGENPMQLRHLAGCKDIP